VINPYSSPPEGRTMMTEQDVERMVQENTGLVGMLVSRTMRLFPRLPSGYDREDLQSLGYLGLIRAAKTFDPTRGVAFSTYAYRCIETTITGALRRESDRQIDCISLSLLIGEEENNPLEELLAHQGPDAAAEAFISYDRELMEYAMEGLPEQQAKLIRMIYFDGETVSQIAQLWSLNAQAVQNIHLKALKTMRIRLKRRGVRRGES
jgi:RNA polymerase sigma factor (sigma-70 family)